MPPGWAPLGLPYGTLGVSGRAAPGAGMAGNKLTLTPTLCPSSLYLVVTFPGWSGDGLAWPHPAWLKVSSPCQGLHPIQTGPTPRHSEGQVPSIWCPWPAPSAGAGALVETTQNPIVGARSGFPARAGTRASPSTAGQMAQPGRTRPHPPQDALQRMLPMQPLSPPLVPSRAAPLPAALLGGLCHPAAEVLMVLCPALNYFPDCHRHVLASGAGCDPAEPDAAAAAWGANGRSTPHVEFNYWLSSLTEYIG